MTKHNANRRRSSLILMSVPGRRDDASDATWFAYDLGTRKPVASGERGDMADLVVGDHYRVNGSVVRA